MARGGHYEHRTSSNILLLHYIVGPYVFILLQLVSTYLPFLSIDLTATPGNSRDGVSSVQALYSALTRLVAPVLDLEHTFSAKTRA